MAVSIDTVYQRVLAIANKEQRGYITPQEFNLFANQAQMDIFEQYFYDFNQFGRISGNDTSHADMLSILEEKISIFERTGENVANGTDLPQVEGRELYRLQIVRWNGKEAEYVNQKDYLNIYTTPLGKPTDSRPIYVRNYNGIAVFGKDQKRTGVKCNYLKKPNKAVWGYVIVGENALYEESSSDNFELHVSEENNLVMKILALAGIAIKDATVYQAASTEETKSIQQQKQ